jgi:hypothetical protein
MLIKRRASLVSGSLPAWRATRAAHVLKSGASDMPISPNSCPPVRSRERFLGSNKWSRSALMIRLTRNPLIFPTKPFRSSHAIVLKRWTHRFARRGSEPARGSREPFNRPILRSWWLRCAGVAGRTVARHHATSSVESVVQLVTGTYCCQSGYIPMTSPVNLAIWALGGLMLFALAIGFFAAPV